MNSTRRPASFLLTRHWVTLVGLGLVITAVVSLLFVLPQHVRGHVDNPYVGVVIFLILPVIFFAGLILIPIGIWLSKQQIRKGLSDEVIDRRSARRRLAWFFGATTLVNVLLGTQVTYRAVKHMETPQFCGATCHSMRLEFAAYQNSPHSKVECVECHVAPGAAGWVNSKTAGMRQLVETVLRTYPKPIKSALESNRLVPATETCENCHWPQKFSGATIRVINEYADDEANTRTQTVLLMLVGGSRIRGIHGAHFGPGVHIRFAVTDPARQSIPWVEYRDATRARTFATSASTGDAAKGLATYDMQCVDCHNRPTHTFEPPDRAMDKALALGDISLSLPYIKKKAVEVLKAEYSTNKDASDRLPRDLVDYYQRTYPDVYAKRSQDVHHAAEAVLAIYNRNVSPDLKVSWGTYPNNLGHTDFPGCFRCHDGLHSTATGETISQDCNTCHEQLATDEASPEILKTLGIAERISNVEKK